MTIAEWMRRVKQNKPPLRKYSSSVFASNGFFGASSAQLRCLCISYTTFSINCGGFPSYSALSDTFSIRRVRARDVAALDSNILSNIPHNEFPPAKNPQDQTSNTPVSGAMPKKLKPSASADESYRPLISSPETDNYGRRDVEAVSSENIFSLLNYFCFFVIGLSMMWTWYTLLLTHFSISNMPFSF